MLSAHNNRQTKILREQKKKGGGKKKASKTLQISIKNWIIIRKITRKKKYWYECIWLV